MTGLDKWIALAALGWLAWLMWRDHVELEQHRASERARRNLGRSQQ